MRPTMQPMTGWAGAWRRAARRESATDARIGAGGATTHHPQKSNCTPATLREKHIALTTHCAYHCGMALVKCTNCGEEGHSMFGCPKAPRTKDANGDTMLSDGSGTRILHCRPASCAAGRSGRRTAIARSMQTRAAASLASDRRQSDGRSSRLLVGHHVRLLCLDLKRQCRPRCATCRLQHCPPASARRNSVGRPLWRS